MEKLAGGFGYFRRCFPALWLGSRIRRALRLRSGETVRPGRPGNETDEEKQTPPKCFGSVCRGPRGA